MRTVNSPACVTEADLFLHPLFEDGAHSATERQELANLTQMAESVCRECPLRKNCLFTAVVEHDVSGFVAGTSEADRRTLRRKLGVQVRAESLDDFVGSLAPTGRQVDTSNVWKLRHTKPGASLKELATELGCSLSTVKRHLKRKPQVKPVRVKPSVEQVWHAFTELRASRDRRPQMQMAS